MIKKSTLTAISQHQPSTHKLTTKKKLPLSSSNSQKSVTSQDGECVTFDAGRII